MFGKLEETSSINTSGVGLGLNICKQIVEALDGEIYLEDSSENGTTFTFLIKCYQQAEFDEPSVELNTRFLRNEDINFGMESNAQSFSQEEESDPYKLNIPDEYNFNIKDTTYYLGIIKNLEPVNDLELMHSHRT